MKNEVTKSHINFSSLRREWYIVVKSCEMRSWNKHTIVCMLVVFVMSLFRASF